MIAQVKPFLEKPFIRYLVVGGISFVVEYLSFVLLYSIFTSWLIIDNGVSYVFGLGTGFLLNRLWVFRSTEKDYSKRAGHQLVIYICLASVNLLLTLLLVSFFKRQDIDPLIGKLLAMAITSIWNFIIYKVLIFNHNSAK